MSAHFGWRRDWRGPARACLLCLAFAAPPALSSASAGEDGAAAAPPAGGKGTAPPGSQTPADAPQSSPRWTFSAEGIGLERLGGADQTLVQRVPGTVPFYAFPPAPPLYDTAIYPGFEALNSNQLRQGFAAGPKLGLTYRDPSGLGFELTYFDVLGFSAARAIGPDIPANWLVMKAPGSFWQTQDFPYQAMRWKDATTLYSVEANGRLSVSSRVTLLAGFRFLEVNDELQGTLTPFDLGQPTWKMADPSSTLWRIADPPLGTPPAINPPFWTTKTTNDLYGFQIGVDGKLWELGPLSLDGLIKAGVYDDSAGQSALVSMAKQLYPAHAATNAAAFAGEAELNATYQLGKGFALKAGYEALWLDGLALAPGQISQTYTTSPSLLSPSTPISASALSVSRSAAAFFQGLTFGLAYSF